jgi:pimeloyl-ACP methyl ester carboxylesterase
VENVVEELHALLTEGEVEGPYVLVGHSMGGVYARAYAFRYPEEVAGMVLVDTAHEEQRLRYPAAVSEADRRMMGQLAQFLLVPQLANSLGLLAMSPQDYPPEFLPPLPEEAKDVYTAVIVSDTRHFATIREQYAHLDEYFAEVQDMEITTLGDIPLVVLSAGQNEFPEAYGLTAEDIAEMQTMQSEMHAELAALSPQGEVLVAEERGHYIQFDQPELVIQAINQVLNAQQ